MSCTGCRTRFPTRVYADIGYLAAYPLLVGGVVLLARPELAGIARGALLDGAVGGLCCAAAGSILIVQPELKGLGGSSLTRIVGGAYPVLDLALLALLVGVITIIGGWPSALWFWLTSGIVAKVLADSL